MNEIVVFDRLKVRRQRDRAAAALGGHAFLFAESGERLADRLDDIKRRFPLALDLGCHDGLLAPLLKGRGGIERLVQCDLSPKMAARAPGMRLAADEEALPFGPASFDLVLSNLSLHWVNDLPGAFAQIRHALKEDGLFLAAMLGGGTLAELRACLAEAEIEIEGGVSPRVSPFADLRDAAGLLQRAGFALPVADSETITVRYADPFTLLADLRGMGETNAIAARRRSPLRRATLMRAMELYVERYAGADGRVPASFEILTLTGWKPHESQPKPLARGSGQVDLGEILKG